MSARAAVFLDRDGTLIEAVHYLRDPDRVRVLPGVSGALREFAEMGHALVVVTNQAAIGKGLLTEDGLRRVNAELARQLARDGVQLDGWYHCPVVGTDPTRELIEHPDRKPGPGMLLRAAAELNLDVAESWMVGDAISDALAGRHAGCRATVLVRGGLAGTESEQHPAVDHTVDGLAEVPALMRGALLSPAPDDDGRRGAASERRARGRDA